MKTTYSEISFVLTFPKAPISGANVPAARQLKALAQIIPANVQLDRVSFDGSRVTVNVIVEEEASIRTENAIMKNVMEHNHRITYCRIPNA